MCRIVCSKHGTLMMHAGAKACTLSAERHERFHCLPQHAPATHGRELDKPAQHSESEKHALTCPAQR